MAQAGTARETDTTSLRRVLGRWRQGAASAFPGRTAPLRVAFPGLAVVVLAYVVTVVARNAELGNRALDGWAVDAIEFAAAGLCLSRALVAPGRWIALLLGLGLSAWAVGDTLAAVRFSAPTAPPAADLCYLAFYPLAFAAVIGLMRREAPQVSAPQWLDAAVAGTGAAAVCAAFAFGDVVHATGERSFTAAVNLAYPAGDVVLLALVVGGTALLSGARRAKWLLVVAACSINAIGDTFNLLHQTSATSPVGAAFNATAWPVAMLLFALAVWVRPRPTTVPQVRMSAGFVLPLLAATAGIVILIVGTVRTIGAVALALAAATVVLTGARLVVSMDALRTVNEERHRQSITDELTGLRNRRFLSQVFETVFSGNRDEGRTLAFLFVDLDHFKEVNDSFGHSVGDELLRQLGPRLAGAIREGDLPIRLGGDEFAVVLPDVDAAQASVVAERIAHALREPFRLAGLPIYISASIGIAVAPTDGTDPAVLVQRADVAMYRAKLSKAAFSVYDPALDSAGDSLHLMEELRASVDGDRLVLYFQPQLDLRTGGVPVLEALVRWEHPTLGTIPPFKFLPLAEEAGLMPALTARVLDGALSQCARWHADGHEVGVSVNISVTNLLDPGFVASVAAALARHRFPPEGLVLEITETCVISDYEQSKRVIDALRRIGVATSIDDFGAGFTSLAHLANLSVSELKLDRTFILGVMDPHSERDLELVRSTINLGHALGLRIVAEGVEDPDTLRILTEMGCDLAQGFQIAEPAPAASLDLASGTLVRAG